MPHFSSRVNDAIGRIVCSARGIVTELTNRQSNSSQIWSEIFRVVWIVDIISYGALCWLIAGGMMALSVRALDFRLIGCVFVTFLGTIAQWPKTSYLHMRASVTKQYNLIPVRGRWQLEWKPVPDMTCHVFAGTLNLTQPGDCRSDDALAMHHRLAGVCTCGLKDLWDCLWFLVLYTMYM